MRFRLPSPARMLPAQVAAVIPLPFWSRGLRWDQHLYLAQLFLMQIVLCLDVVVGLHVDPVPLRQPEGPGEPEAGIGRDPAPAVDDLTNPGLRQSSRLSEPVLADSQRLKELGEKDLAGSNGVVHLRAHQRLPSQW